MDKLIRNLKSFCTVKYRDLKIKIRYGIPRLIKYTVKTIYTALIFALIFTLIATIL